MTKTKPVAVVSSWLDHATRSVKHDKAGNHDKARQFERLAKAKLLSAKGMKCRILE